MIFQSALSLWFDVEEGYNTTIEKKRWRASRCGLM